jgi:toxin-antitoxin system PIN domain toxin
LSVALLDVNVLLALAWPSHLHHEAAHRWFTAHYTAGWATCPMTQCAFVRISMNPRYAGLVDGPVRAVALLECVADLPYHEFWVDDLPFSADEVPKAVITGHRQISDAYLLGLAAHRGGKLVTLDRGIASIAPPESALSGVLEIIPTE